MRHEMLNQRARFCIGVMAKKGTLSQHFVTHVVPPLSSVTELLSALRETCFPVAQCREQGKKVC